MQAYFRRRVLNLGIHKTVIGEKAKPVEALLSIVGSISEFGIIRKVCNSDRALDGKDGTWPMGWL